MKKLNNIFKIKISNKKNTGNGIKIYNNTALKADF